MHHSLSNLIAAKAALVPTPFRNSNWLLLRYALAFISILLVSTRTITFEAYTIRLIVLCSSHLVVCDFFSIGMSTDSSQSSDHTPVLYILLQSSTNVSAPTVPIAFHISAGIPSGPSDLPWCMALTTVFPLLRSRDLIYPCPLFFRL